MEANYASTDALINLKHFKITSKYAFIKETNLYCKHGRIYTD